MEFKQIGSLLLPSDFPDKVGLGCPKCDDHELIPIALAAGAVEANEAMRSFLKRHEHCGAFEQLEQRNGKTVITGRLEPEHEGS